MADHWCDQVKQALTKPMLPLDEAAQYRAYNILSYLLHWSASKQVTHGFKGQRRERTEHMEHTKHTERLKAMMVSFLHVLLPALRKSLEALRLMTPTCQKQKFVPPIMVLNAVTIIVCLLIFILK